MHRANERGMKAQRFPATRNLHSSDFFQLRVQKAGENHNTNFLHEI